MKNELKMWDDIGQLDYIGEIENVYIPSYDVFEYRDSTDIIMIPIDDETFAGFSEEEIRAKMPEIIEFAELGRFIDMPVKTYSSGMHSKLAFAITAILETEIMLIDEVLSVGDHKFKKKSYAKMKELISNKERTVVIVSHSIDTLKDLCDRVMWMHDGEIKRLGDPVEVLDEYQEFMK